MQDKLLQLNLESLRLGLVSSEKFINRPILVFNSASFCGFTKQIHDMQKVYEAGNVVPMALPTNEFGKQECTNNTYKTNLECLFNHPNGHSN